MPSKDSGVSGPTPLFTKRNVLLITVALATVGAGYAVLVSDPAGGSASAAAVLLVLGYIVLFPLALLA